MATGEPPEFSRYFTESSELPHFDAEDEHLLLVHPDDVLRQSPTTDVLEGADAGANSLGSKPMPPQPSGAGQYGSGKRDELREPEASAVVHKLVVNGRIDLQQFFNIYPCLVEPFKNNDVSIELTVKAYSTKEHPIIEGSQRMKSLQETVQQMGLMLRKE